MANSRDSAPYREYVTVNAEPAGTGYFTNSVFIRDKDLEHIFFSVRETGTGAGVKSDDSSAVGTQNYTSGEFTFGFDW